MSTCAKCGNHFPVWTKVQGKKRNLSSRKYCLDCSPFKKKNTFQLHQEESTDRVLTVHCSSCGRVYPYDRDHRNGSTKSRCNACVTRARQRKLKRQGIEILGGGCLICGYSRCQEALDFHHRDPAEKDFTISHHWNRAWKVLEKEILKCALLCNRCHTEVHAGVSSIP